MNNYSRVGIMLALLSVACGDADPESSDTGSSSPKSETACGGHGTREEGAFNCDCDEGYDLDPSNMNNCLPNRQTCGGHGSTMFTEALTWSCACDEGYEVDTSDPTNCVAGNGDNGGNGSAQPTCANRDVEYGTDGTSSCTFSWGQCTDGVSYSIECSAYYVSGHRIVECDCMKQGTLQGDPVYPDGYICLYEDWSAIEAVVNEECGWFILPPG